MSTIKVDTIATRTGSGNITASNTIAGTSATLSGTLGVTGATTTGNITTGNTSIITGGRFISSQTSNDPWLKGVNSSNTETSYIKKDGQIYSAFGLSVGGTGAANTLDDYEEGTWTPTLGNVSAPTFTSRNGTYTKIGRIVYITCEIIVASGLDTSDGSTMYIQGFPFSGNSTNESCVFSIGRLSTLISNRSVVAGRFLGDGLALKEGGANELAYNECASSGTLQFACTYSTS